jgi:hypothetical protein
MSTSMFHHRCALALASLLFLAVLFVISTARARGDTVFDNGLPSTSFSVGVSPSLASPPNYATAAFTLSGPTLLTGVEADLWVDTLYPFDNPVLWSIGPSAFSSANNGTGVLSYTDLGVSSDGYELFSAAFDLTTPFSLQAGTYWLTLSANPGAWNATFLAASAAPTNDQQAIFTGAASPGGYAYYAPVSFQIDGEPQAVPEPSTFALLGVAALGLIACAWRRRGTKA